MADFNFITPRLATGAAITSDADVQALLAAGINTVIDCRAEFDDGALLAKAGIAYLWNGTDDDGEPKAPSWFARSLQFALPALALPKNRVYAHCAQGINRGPSTVYCIMRALGFPAGDAKLLIRAKRPVTIGGIRYADDADAAVVSLGYE